MSDLHIEYNHELNRLIRTRKHYARNELTASIVGIRNRVFVTKVRIGPEHDGKDAA